MTCDTLAEEERTCQPRRRTQRLAAWRRRKSSHIIFINSHSISGAISCAHDPFATTERVRVLQPYPGTARPPPPAPPEDPRSSPFFMIMMTLEDPLVDAKKNDLLSNVITHHRSLAIFLGA